MKIWFPHCQFGETVTVAAQTMLLIEANVTVCGWFPVGQNPHFIASAGDEGR